MKNTLKYICILVFIGLLGVAFVNSPRLASVAVAPQNKVFKDVISTNEEGLNPYRFYSYGGYGSVKELCAASNTVIKGEVITVHAPEVLITGTITHGNDTEPLKDVYTVSDVRVIESIKGTLKPGDVIQVKQLGGFYKDREYPTDHPETYTKNMQGVFFLITYDNGPADHINPSQGFVKLINGKIENRPYLLDEHYTPSEESKGSDGRLFENGMDQKDLINLIKESI